MSAAPPRSKLRAAFLFVAKLALVGVGLLVTSFAAPPAWIHVLGGSLVALALVVVLSRAKGRRIVTAFGLLATAPLLVFAAKLGMDARITSAPLGCACSYCLGDWDLAGLAFWPFQQPDGWFAFLAPFTFPLVGALGALVPLLLVRARVSFSRRIRAGGGLVLRAGSLASMALAAALLVHGFVHAARYPAADTYLPSLPEAGLLPPALGKPTEVLDYRVSKFPAILDVYKDHVDGLSIERSCNVLGSLCEFSIGGQRTCQNLVERSAAVTLRRDAAHDFITIDDGSHRFAFRGGTLIHVTTNDIADAVSPARGWLVVGCLGMLLAGWLAVRRRRAEERLDAAALDVLAAAAAWIGIAPLLATLPLPF
ncbi:hypothetical protein [Polyangium jinanense]|uniref:Uncharacterized protein n=1 Tax=Polyangium jinanense TaxID=2829994 RepID=A0A9X3XE40_9BACT|nr:hypothetical protein [Polyangium jinanense]MDC3961829.1 hypothetical protein [Polyangium jinanense]MDC3988557.1 hypothetical protein [Polyangium jinanense]